MDVTVILGAVYIQGVVSFFTPAISGELVWIFHVLALDIVLVLRTLESVCLFLPLNVDMTKGVFF